jgi:hypothetical protein
MSNTSSDTSTPAAKKPRRRRPPLLPFFLILASLIYGVFRVLPVMREQNAALLEDARSNAEPLAEELELQWEASDPSPAETLDPLLRAQLDADPTLAYVQVWDAQGHQITVRGRGTSGEPFPALGADRVVHDVLLRATQAEWQVPVAGLQRALSEQEALNKAYSGHPPAIRARILLTDRQARNRELTATLTTACPSARDAVDAMDAAREAVQAADEPERWVDAATQGDTAENALLLALGEYRGTTDFPPGPFAGMLSEDPHSTWLGTLTGTPCIVRTTAPLFTTGEGDALLKPLGMVDIGTYTDTGAAVGPLLHTLWPSLAVIVLALFWLLLARRRRRRR